MTDLTPTIQAKSDQLNADDLMAGPITIKISSVGFGSGEDQPINIRYDGDNGKPWKPCKSMRRVLVFVWGADGENYIGRSLTLWRDPSVKWAGKEVGGIRISHMTGIDKPVSMSLTATRGSKKPHTVQVLQASKTQPVQQSETQDDGFPISDGDWLNWVRKMDESHTLDDIKNIGKEISQVSGSYDKESVSKLKAYYGDRLKTIKGEGQ